MAKNYRFAQKPSGHKGRHLAGRTGYRSTSALCPGGGGVVSLLSCTRHFFLSFFFVGGFLPAAASHTRVCCSIYMYILSIIWINSRIWIIYYYYIYYKNVRSNLTYIIFWGVMFPISRLFSPFPQRHYKNSSLSLSLSLCVCECVSPSSALYCRRILLLLLHPALFLQNHIDSHSLAELSPGTAWPPIDSYQMMGYVVNIMKIICRPSRHLQIYIYLWVEPTIHSKTKRRNGLVAT